MPLSSVVGAQSIVKPGVCTSTTKPASPFDGQVIYMTDVDQSAVWDGTSWVGLDPSRDRNVVINGAMQVAQRGTSVAGITVGGLYTVDRFFHQLNVLGTYTDSVEADAPTGSGFRNSLKVLCTTAAASPAAGAYHLIEHRLEGQNLQQFLKGTASAKQFALSFWVKSNKTGTYIVELYDTDGNRSVSLSYTVIASATWEKKTIVFPADTTGAFTNDNNLSLSMGFWLGAGTDFASGTLATTWGAATSANRAVGQTNLAAATSNYWQVTGIQLEAGAVATPFEFEDIGTTLAKCQRYYQLVATGTSKPVQNGTAYSTSQWYGVYHNKVSMRTAPTLVVTNGTNHWILYGNNNNFAFTTLLMDQSSTETVRFFANSGLAINQGSGFWLETNNAASSVALSAEL